MPLNPIPIQNKTINPKTPGTLLLNMKWRDEMRGVMRWRMGVTWREERRMRSVE